MLSDELQREVGRGPEPAATATRLAAVLDAAPDLAAAATADPTVGTALVAVCGASRVLPVIVSRLGTDAADILTGRTAPSFDAETPETLRRQIGDHLLAIAAADLTGRLTMPEVGAALSDLADAATNRAVAIAGADGIAVIALGKWGGRELNYASDIDLVVVHDGAEQKAAAEVARIIELLSSGGPGESLTCDLDLRPEGAAGPLSRSLDSYRSYWERWAEPWEAQAMLKARVAAGDPALGAAFIEALQPFVFPETLGADAVRSIRAMKARTEAAMPDELKRGVGGIRDVEFAVQLLQLVHGRADPRLRSANTLAALDLLADGGYVARADADDLGASYRWLRDVEHRLQLYDLRPAHDLPADPVIRERVAKACGYRDEAASPAVDAFEAELIAHRAGVRTIHERLFYRPLMEAFADEAATPIAVERQIAALGFSDSTAMRTAVADLTAGMRRRSGLMRQLMPMLLRWLSESPDPDLGLAQLHRLASGSPNEEALTAVLRDDPAAGERLCRLLGTSRLAGPLAARLPLSSLRLGNDEALAVEPDVAALTDEAQQRLTGRDTDEARAESSRRFYAEHLLETCAADLAGPADDRSVARRLSNLADAVLAAALWSVASSVPDAPPMAVIGLGKLGGHELDYASDLDIVLVFEGGVSGADAAAAKVTERLVSLLGRASIDLPMPELDLALRPEGGKGALARSMDAFRGYWEQWADTWERQALLRARFVAGDETLGATFVAEATAVAVGSGLDEATTREIRNMKVRVERERIPLDEDRAFHVKLGDGGMADVEWTVQLLQMRHGGQRPEILTPSTLEGLARLTNSGLLAQADAAILDEAYRLCARIRNRLFHLVGRSRDSIPTDPQQAMRLAVSLGYELHPRTALREDYKRATRRARRVFERVFYME